jgi:hypothetical protein
MEKNIDNEMNEELQRMQDEWSLALLRKRDNDLFEKMAAEVTKEVIADRNIITDNQSKPTRNFRKIFLLGVSLPLSLAALLLLYFYILNPNEEPSISEYIAMASAPVKIPVNDTFVTKTEVSQNTENQGNNSAKDKQLNGSKSNTVSNDAGEEIDERYLTRGVKKNHTNKDTGTISNTSKPQRLSQSVNGSNITSENPDQKTIIYKEIRYINKPELEKKYFIKSGIIFLSEKQKGGSLSQKVNKKDSVEYLYKVPTGEVYLIDMKIEDKIRDLKLVNN